VLNLNKGALRLGLSATPSWLQSPYRASILEVIVGPVVEGPSVRELIERGVLAKPVIHFVHLPSLGCKGKSPTVCFSEKADEACEQLVKTLKGIELGPRFLVLVPTVKLGKCIAEKLGIPFAYSGNRQVLERVRGRGSAVATSQLIQMGYDDPSLTGLVIADVVANPWRLYQMLGRALRGGKKRVTIVDVCWNDYKEACEKRGEVHALLTADRSSHS